MVPIALPISLVSKPVSINKVSEIDLSTWVMRLSYTLSYVSLLPVIGSSALLMIGLRPTLRAVFRKALVLGLKRFASRAWVRTIQ